MKNSSKKVSILYEGKKMEVSMSTIQYNFDYSELDERAALRVGEGGKRGFETIEEYIELLKNDRLTTEPFNAGLKSSGAANFTKY